MHTIFFVVTIASVVLAFPNPEDGNAVDEVNEIKKDCVSGILNLSCLKVGAITILDKFNNKDEVTLVPGVSLVKEQGKLNTENVASDLARSFSSDSDSNLDKSLLHKLGSFLDSHAVKLRLLDDSAVEEAKTAFEGRRRRTKGNMNGLIAMAAMMKGTMMSIALGALALLAGKALVTALMSLLLSAIIGLKSLSNKGSTTYEIVSKPIYTHSHSHSTAHEDAGGYSHGGYGRNLKARRR